MLSFTEVFQNLEAMGLTDVILPFTLIFAVIFAILGMVKIFGEKKNINVVVALVIALLVVVPHVTGGYPPGKDVVEIINTSIPNVSVIIIAVLMFLILLGIFGVQIDVTQSSYIGPLVGMLCLGAVFFIFGSSAGWFGGSGTHSGALSFLNNSETVSVLLVILMFVGIVALVTGEGGGTGRLRTGINSVFNEFGKIMGRR